MTYKQIQSEYKKLYNRSIKTCWIADVKRELGLTKRVAYNRKDELKVVYPCTDKIMKDRIRHIINKTL